MVETFLDIVEETRLVDGAGYVPNPISWARGSRQTPGRINAPGCARKVPRGSVT